MLEVWKTTWMPEYCLLGQWAIVKSEAEEREMEKQGGPGTLSRSNCLTANVMPPLR